MTVISQEVCNRTVDEILLAGEADYTSTTLMLARDLKAARLGMATAVAIVQRMADEQSHDCPCLDNTQNPPECSLIADGRDCLCAYAAERFEEVAKAMTEAGL